MSSTGKNLRRKEKNQSSADNGGPPRPPIPPLALTIPEAAAAARVSPSFIYEEIRDGRLRAVKLRGSTRILMTDLLEYLHSCPPLGPAGDAK